MKLILIAQMSLLVACSLKCNELVIGILIHSFQFINEVHLTHGVLPLFVIFLLLLIILVRYYYHLIAIIRHVDVSRTMLLLHGERTGFLGWNFAIQNRLSAREVERILVHLILSYLLQDFVRITEGLLGKGDRVLGESMNILGRLEKSKETLS